MCRALIGGPSRLGGKVQERRDASGGSGLWQCEGAAAAFKSYDQKPKHRLERTMTHIKTCALITTTAFCLPAFAMGQNATQADSNEDGVLSLAEVQAVYPQVTEDMFITADLNGDGALEDAEITAAQEAGLMPSD
jgi:hypothetical protein